MEYDAAIAEGVKRNAEAREAWANGRQLVVGAYYPHGNGIWLRRIVDVEGHDVIWTDHVGAGRCMRAVFVRTVAAPL